MKFLKTDSGFQVEYSALEPLFPTWVLLILSVLFFSLAFWTFYELVIRKKIFQNLVSVGIYLLLISLLAGSCAQNCYTSTETEDGKTILDYQKENKKFLFYSKESEGKSLPLEFPESEFYCLKLDIQTTSKSTNQKNSTTPSGFDVRYDFYLVHTSGLEFPLYRDTFVIKSSQTYEELTFGRKIIQSFFEQYKLLPPLPLIEEGTGLEIDIKNYWRTDNLVYPKLVQSPLSRPLKKQVDLTLKPFRTKENGLQIKSNASQNYFYYYCICIGLVLIVCILQILFTRDFDSWGERLVVIFLLVFPGVLVFKGYTDLQQEGSYFFEISNLNIRITEEDDGGKTKQTKTIDTKDTFLFWNWFADTSPIQWIPRPAIASLQKMNKNLHPRLMGLSHPDDSDWEAIGDAISNVPATFSLLAK